MRYKYVFAARVYKDSPCLEQCIYSFRAQTIPSRTITCTSTPNSYVDRLAQKYGLQICVRRGESSIRGDWDFAYSTAEGELAIIAHQDDIYHCGYSARLLAAHRRYPDMIVFTTDYVTVKQGVLIAGDTMLWIKRIPRTPLQLPQMNDRAWVEKLTFVLGNPICCLATTCHEAALNEPFVHSKCSFALDWNNLVRLAEELGHFICDERPLLYCRVHEGATTKVCIRGNRRFTEERETFCRFWLKPVADITMGSCGKACGEYEQQFPGLENRYGSEKKMQG